MSHAEAVKRVDGGSNKSTREQVGERADWFILLEKDRVLAFIAMVVNCGMEVKKKSERIGMVIDAAPRFLDIGDVAGEDLQSILRDGVTPTGLNTGSG